jgi:hypothetical protein
VCVRSRVVEEGRKVDVQSGWLRSLISRSAACLDPSTMSNDRVRVRVRNPPLKITTHSQNNTTGPKYLPSDNIRQYRHRPPRKGTTSACPRRPHAQMDSRCPFSRLRSWFRPRRQRRRYLPFHKKGLFQTTRHISEPIS